MPLVDAEPGTLAIVRRRDVADPVAGPHADRRRHALAIGPMFSMAVVLGFVSAPVTGAGFNTALAVLVVGLGVLAIAYAISIFAANTRVRVPSMSTSCGAPTRRSASSRPAFSSILPGPP